MLDMFEEYRKVINKIRDKCIEIFVEEEDICVGDLNEMSINVQNRFLSIKYLDDIFYLNYIENTENEDKKEVSFALENVNSLFDFIKWNIV